jgi:hypothetical protein
MVRLSSRCTVLGVVTDVSEQEIAAAAARVERVYRSVPDFESAVASAVTLPALRAGVIVVADRAIELPADGTVTWGLPLGASGVATADEIERVLREPQRVGDLGGIFVVARLTSDSVRLVSSTDFVFTLRRAGSTFATRSVAALALAGISARVDPDAVGEYLALYSVVGKGELLTGVEACEEGTVVDVTASGIRQRLAVPLQQRLRPGAPPTPAEFRDALGRWIVRAGTVPGAALALTAGRDSGLVASCLAADGAALPTVTHTVPGFPDNRGAMALARRYGWPHEALRVTYPDGSALPRWTHPLVRVPGGDVVDYLTRQAAWCEGMQHPRDALIGHFTRPAGGLPVITGHGGETGRAYFWKNLPDGPTIDCFVDHGPGWHLPSPAKDRLRATVEAEVSLVSDLGWPDARLDLMYPRRQRSWLDHSGLADAPYTDLLPAFLTTEMTRLMLDIPRADRRTGAFFDAALALDPADPRGVALRAARTPAWAARLGKLNPYKVPNDLHLLTSVMAAFEPGGWLVRDILGDEWWRWAVDNAPSLPSVRGVLWSSIGIEALRRWLATGQPA